MKDWYRDLDDRLWLLADEMPPEQARFIKRALGLRKGQRVLDVPCGAGRTSLALAKLGVEVTGVDLRSKFTNRAKRRFRKEGLSGTFLVGDMRELDFDGEFHGVVNWFSSFGYFSETQNLDVLRRFARAVRPGGRVLIHQVNREYTLRHFYKETRQTLRQARRRGPGTLVIRRRWHPKSEYFQSTWTLEVKGQRRSYQVWQRAYTPKQFRALFTRAGLRVEAVYGSTQCEAYRRSSRSLFIAGRKPK
jgi:cyclopropane fatty-acyl-phospholipid synthase-like methyltransferase